MIDSHELLELQKVDELLHTLSLQLALHRFMNPINVEQERKSFLAKKKSNPKFIYPDLNRALLEKIEKTAQNVKIPGEGILSDLLKRKATHLVNSVAALQSRDSSEFFVRLGASVPYPVQAEKERAERILRLWKNEPKKKEKSKAFLNALEMKARVERTLTDMGVTGVAVEMRSVHSGRMSVVDGRTILIKSTALFSEKTVPATIAHEIGVHVVRAFNGEAQPLRMFQNSTPGYLATEEGLGAIASRLFRQSPYFSTVALSLVTVDFAQTHSFRETFDMLRQQWGIGEKKAWRYVFRAKRGMMQTAKPGANPRDAQYLRGVFEIEQYLEQGGSLSDLFVGKVGLSDVAPLLKLSEIQKPKVIPAFFVGQEQKVLQLIKENN